jgi:thymidine phosphorylase
LDVVEVITTKRDGRPLTDAQIRWFIDSYTKGVIADEQASALLMAVVWRGMTDNELNVWTAAMIDSGTTLDLSSVSLPTVDKHSTGGVGDKISLVLAPLVAACGVADPMLSGRGLGHTGGTLDKLEAIPGYNVNLDAPEMLRVLREVGCVICSAGPDLAPADRKLYALRDVTGTVESIPLIASSIMSKKIAEGTAALVLDVKVGSGAFMPDVTSARELATTMVRLGEAHGVKTSALLTAMDEPLGRTAGNGLEVSESIATLKGQGPADVTEVTLALAQEMLELTGADADPAARLADGSALAKWNALVAAQGGDASAELERAEHVRQVTAPASGFLRRLDARGVGVAAWRLGAGRSNKDEPVSAVAGVVCLKKRGDTVEEGEPLLELHTDNPKRFEAAQNSLAGAIEIGAEAPEPRPLVLESIRP